MFTVNDQFAAVLAQAGLVGQGAFQYQGGTELVKPALGCRQRIRIQLSHGGQDITLYLKRLTSPPVVHQIPRILFQHPRHSSCWWERRIIEQLHAVKIPTMTVAAWGEKMAWIWEKASVLITQEVDGQSLERFLPNLKVAPRGAELAAWRESIRKLGRFIGNFHRAGFCHRDLYTAHIFVSFDQAGCSKFALIDLARAFKVTLRKRRWQVKDLASLNYSTPENIGQADRLRFFKAYLDIRHLDRRARRLVRSISAKTAAIAKHDNKVRSRPPQG